MNKIEISESPHLNTKQLAKRLQVHPITIAKWRVAGRGPRYMAIGSNILYPMGEIEKWEQMQIRRSTAENI